MPHSHGSSMDMGDGAECTMNMTWNWQIIDSCFLATSWHIKNGGMFGATVVGVFLLAIVLEFVRRVGKEYEQFIVRQFQQHVSAQVSASKLDDDANCPNFSGSGTPGPRTAIFRPSLIQQLTRSVLHAVAFGIAYILMLIAMAFNGYVIIAIIIGAGVGKFLCDWTSQRVVVEAWSSKGLQSPEEATMCCG